MARIGIIGTGWGARTQVPAFRKAGLEVVAIAGRDFNRTRAIAAELSLKPFDDWRDLATSDLDLISIVTPPSEHLTMTTTVLDAGKHVLCEKPTALNTAEAEQLVAASAKHPDLLTLIDHELRFLPSWRSALVQLDEIGPLWFAEVRYSSPARGDRKRAWNWWSDASHGGGIWGAVGSHYVDALRYLIGEVESVQGSLHTFIQERPSEDGPRAVTSDDYAAVQLTLRGDVRAAMTFTVVSGVDEPTALTIHGEGGAVRLTGTSFSLARRGEPFVLQQTSHTSENEEMTGNSPGGAFGSGTIYLGHALRQALDDGETSALAPAATFTDGLAQQRVLDAVHESSRNQGRLVTL